MASVSQENPKFLALPVPAKRTCSSASSFRLWRPSSGSPNLSDRTSNGSNGTDKTHAKALRPASVAISTPPDKARAEKGKAARRHSGQPEVYSVAEVISSTRRKLSEEFKASLRLRERVRESEDRVEDLGVEVGRKGGQARALRHENSKLKAKCEELEQRMRDLHVSLADAQQAIISQHSSGETVYGWYMALLLENEGIKSKGGRDAA